MFMKIAAVDLRIGWLGLPNAKGVQRDYNVWWTGGWDGLQKNVVTKQFRYVRCDP